LIWSYQEKYQF